MRLTTLCVQELAKLSEQLKSSNESRIKLKSKLEDALASKCAQEETAQGEQQRLTFALEEMRAEMEVLKAIYQDELNAAKRAAAENTRAATTQLGEQAEDALARLGSAHVKLEAAERRLESLGVDAVSLQVLRTRFMRVLFQWLRHVMRSPAFQRVGGGQGERTRSFWRPHKDSNGKHAVVTRRCVGIAAGCSGAQ